MENKYKYIAVIKNEAGALKCVINENEKPKFEEGLTDDYNLLKVVEWSEKHKIIDFASHYDINKCRTFAITKHYESGNEMLHSEALSKGIEVDCIEIREQFSDDLKEVIGYKAYFKEKESTLTLKKSRFYTFIMPEESTDEYILRRLKEKSGQKLRARIDILDDLAKRFGKQENIQSFEEFYSFYNFDANVMLI
jgi:hypothetical protein